MLLNKNGIITLVALVDMLASDGFMVVDKSEIMTALHDKLQLDELNVCLRELRDRGYIKVKFNDNEEVCLAINAIARDTVMDLRKVELEKMTHAALVTKNTKGDMVITSIDDNSPAFEEEKENLPAVVELPQEEIVGKKKKKAKPMGRFATFIIGTCGGLFGSGVVASIIYLLTTLGVM